MNGRNHDEQTHPIPAYPCGRVRRFEQLLESVRAGAFLGNEHTINERSSREQTRANADHCAKISTAIAPIPLCGRVNTHTLTVMITVWRSFFESLPSMQGTVTRSKQLLWLLLLWGKNMIIFCSSLDQQIFGYDRSFAFPVFGDCVMMTHNQSEGKLYASDVEL